MTMTETKAQEQLLASLIADATKNAGSSKGGIDPMQLLVKSVPQFMDGMNQRSQEAAQNTKQLRQINARLKALYQITKRHTERLAQLEDIQEQLEALTETVVSLGSIFEGEHWEIDDHPQVRGGNVEMDFFEERSVDRAQKARAGANGQARNQERYIRTQRRNAERQRQ